MLLIRFCCVFNFCLEISPLLWLFSSVHPPSSFQSRFKSCSMLRFLCPAQLDVPVLWLTLLQVLLIDKKAWLSLWKEKTWIGQVVVHHFCSPMRLTTSCLLTPSQSREGWTAGLCWKKKIIRSSWWHLVVTLC